MISKHVGLTFYLTLLMVLLLSGCSTHTINKNQLTLVDGDGFVIESAYTFSDTGMLLVSNGKDGDEKRFGFINADGELIIPLEYKGFLPFSEGLVFAVDELGNRGYMDKTGAKVMTEIDGKAINIGDIFVDGYAVANLNDISSDGYENINLEDDKGWYVIDTSGKIHLTPTEEGYQYRNLGGGLFERYSGINTVDPKGVVDIRGQIKYSGSAMLITPANEFNGFYTLNWEEYGIFDNKNFIMLTEPQFVEITRFVDSAAIVVGVDSMVKIIDPSGEEVANLSNEYSNIDNLKLNEFNDGVTALNFTDGMGSVIIDTKGNTVAKTDCDENDLFHDGLAVCKKDGKYGYVDSAGNEVLKPIYELVTNIENGIGFVSNEGKLYRFTY